MNSLIQTLNSEMTAVIQQVRPTLVQLTNGHRGSGAGTIWHTDGLILTNAHVAQRRAPQVTLADGRTFPSQLLAYDEKLDLAALSIEAKGLPVIEPGRSTDLRPGDWVIAIGHPWGVLGAAAAGAVITVGKPLEWNGQGVDMIQVGIQLRPGHSGGPLVNGNGRLVGINTMITGPQVGLAVPVHVVKQFLKEKLGK
jgi:serine protease Do